jgi:hypothetical protein
MVTIIKHCLLHNMTLKYNISNRFEVLGDSSDVFVGSYSKMAEMFALHEEILLFV